MEERRTREEKKEFLYLEIGFLFTLSLNVFFLFFTSLSFSLSDCKCMPVSSL